VLRELVIVLVLLGIVAALAWCFRSAWLHRRVDFVHRVGAGLQVDTVSARVFDRVIPVLVSDGYKMVARAGNTTMFERRSLPGWTILVAIFLFPFGLLALLARNRETITVVSTDGTLDLHGSCSKAHADYLIAVANEVAGHLVSFR
jgi:hypothetical protein